MKYGTFLLFFFVTSCKQTIKQAYADLPPNPGQHIVSDYSNILSASQIGALSKKLYEYETKTSNQVVVITVDSIFPYTDIQKYATDLGSYWEVGQKEKDNGLVVVLCHPCKTIGIATGYGTEKILTDSICKAVIDATMIPEFREKRYYMGIANGIDSLISKWR